MVREHRRFFLWMTLAGLALRLYFFVYFPAVSDDSRVYLDLANNWLHHGIYGQTELGKIVPADTRLPGYPAFLAAIAAICGGGISDKVGSGYIRAVLIAQILFDLLTCFILADLARRTVRGQRAARVAFFLAALCPFLANYAVAVLSETLEIFFTALALDCAVAAVDGVDAGEGWSWWAATGASIGACILLRPDGGILLGAVLLFIVVAAVGVLWGRRGPTSAAKADTKSGSLIAAVNRCATQNQNQDKSQDQNQDKRQDQWQGQEPGRASAAEAGFDAGADSARLKSCPSQNIAEARHSLQAMNHGLDTTLKPFQQLAAAGLIVALVALAPLVPWTVRNFRTLHHFQPLAPRYANQSEETAPRGFNRWVKTWIADYVSVEEIYWSVPGDKIDAGRLPTRALDSSREETLAVIEDYNQTGDLTPQVDGRFGELAAERIRAHPIRSFVGLPLLRVADMWLRPRTELLPPDVRWWEFNDDTRESVLAVGFGLLNLVYVAAAVAAVVLRHRQIRYLGLLVGFLVLRTAFLGTIENPEPRYTLECYPVVIVLLSGWFAGARATSEQLPSAVTG